MSGLVSCVESAAIEARPARRLRKVVEVRADPESVFSYLDDVRNTGAHMQRVGMGGNLEFETLSENATGVGADITFKVNSTDEAANFYYEVMARGRVLFSDYTKSRQITVKTSPQMAPTAKLLVYQILPNSEVAADYLRWRYDPTLPFVRYRCFRIADETDRSRGYVVLNDQDAQLVGRPHGHQSVRRLP